MEPRELRRRARWAYERGRLGAAAAIAWPAPVLVAISIPLAGNPGLHLALGAVLSAVALFLGWRGGEAGAGVRTGLAAGVAPIFAPLVAAKAGFACFGAGCFSPACLVGCVIGGSVAGAIVGLGARRSADKTAWLLGAGTVASLAGALGCAFVGFAGILSMVLAVAAWSAPIAAVRRRAAA
jgi:hypothetical protein